MGCGGSKAAQAEVIEEHRSPTPSPLYEDPAPLRSPTPPPPEPAKYVRRKPSIPWSLENSSDDIATFLIDERIDENEISSTEDGYPVPSPHDISSDEVRPNYNWFEHQLFKTGSDDDHHVYRHEITKDEENLVTDLNLSIVNKALGFGGPKTPQLQPTISFNDIDNHVKGGSGNIADSFQELFSFLTQTIRHSKNRELFTARAIVVWLSLQDVDNNNYGDANMTSPKGLLQFVKEERMTYATCYTILCRKAKLNCTLVQGSVKASGYEPGDDRVPVTSWTAVFVEGYWQIVNPFWICRALYGHRLGGWIKVETDGTNVNRQEQESVGVVVNTFQDCYFMPKPEHYIHTCYASDPPWQLLPNKQTVKSEKDFLRLPYLHQPFFDLGLELTSEKSCVLIADDGKCKVELKAKPSNAHLLVLRYELFLKSSDENESGNLDDEIKSRMVFNSRSNEMFLFEVRFPTEGTYKLVIYGGPYKSSALRLCEFKLVCYTRMKHHLLPLNCSDIGWGPSPVTAENGLVIPSRTNGLIAVPKSKNDRKVKIEFQVKDDFIDKWQYSASMFKAEKDGGYHKSGFERYMNTSFDRRAKVFIVFIDLQIRGEFGLSLIRSPKKRKNDINHNQLDTIAESPPIVENGQVETTHELEFDSDPPEEMSTSARDVNVDGETICNYLLSTVAYRREKPGVRLAKKKLRKAFESNKPLSQKIEEVATCIAECKEEMRDGWKTDDEIRAAMVKLEFLVYKNSLRETHLRRNLQVTRRAIKLVGKYRFKMALQAEILRAENLEHELEALGRYSRDVPRLQTAYQEIVTLINAPDEVHVTFKALCVLLGEPEDDLENWHHIQALIRTSSHPKRDQVFTRMEKIQKHTAEPIHQSRAQQLLSVYDEDRVRTCNTSAHSFYVWVRQVLDAYKDGNTNKDFNEALLQAQNQRRKSVLFD